MAEHGPPGLLDALEAIASAPRLELLHQLRVPQTLSELEIKVPSAAGRERPLTRQTVKSHLVRLAQSNMIVERPTARPYGHTTEFMINNQRLFAVSEEIRQLARLRPIVEPDVVTQLPRLAPQDEPQRVGLLLVRGLDEGTWFDVRPAEGKTHWMIGRSRSCDIALDFDPSVSAQNAVLSWEDGRHMVRNLPSSRNGTRVNLTALGSGQSVALEHGDLIEVGHSALLYWSRQR